MTPGEKLKLIRQLWEGEPSQDEFASIIGESKSRVRNFESERTVLPKSVARKLAEMRGFSWEWFFDPHDTLPPIGAQPVPGQLAAFRARIPYWGQVPAGEWERPMTDIEWVPVPPKFAKENHVALRVGGSSMEPKFLPGDLVIVRLTMKPTLGKVVVVRNTDRELSLKRLVATNSGPVLRSDNPDYGEVAAVDGIEFVGEVVFLMRETL